MADVTDETLKAKLNLMCGLELESYSLQEKREIIPTAITTTTTISKRKTPLIPTVRTNLTYNLCLQKQSH